MQSEVDLMKYYIAAEKINMLLFALDQTLEYMQEFDVKPDEAVKEALKPKIEQLKAWIS